MSSCDQTFDGQHHYAPRKVLYGLPWVDSDWKSEIICVCGSRPPKDDLPSIKAQLDETHRVRNLQFGVEEAEQGKLL